MKKTICLLASLLLCGGLPAQQSRDVWADPSVGGYGKADPRPEFISYKDRKSVV